MDAIDRRHALRGMMCVALAAGFGTTLLPNTVEAMPLAPQKDLVGKDLGSKELGSEADVFEVKPQPTPRVHPGAQWPVRDAPSTIAGAPEGSAGGTEDDASAAGAVERASHVAPHRGGSHDHL